MRLTADRPLPWSGERHRVAVNAPLSAAALCGMLVRCNDGRALGARVGGRVSHGALMGSTRLWPAVHAAVSLMIAAVLVVIWLLSGRRYFWPAWPVRLAAC